jgi:hypothetical protein
VESMGEGEQREQQKTCYLCAGQLNVTEGWERRARLRPPRSWVDHLRDTDQNSFKTQS